jgi:hypothetical protein
MPSENDFKAQLKVVELLKSHLRGAMKDHKVQSLPKMKLKRKVVNHKKK